MKNKTGGPAYPVTTRITEKFCDDMGYARTRAISGLAGGMTLLDHFAGLAMQGMLAADDHANYTNDSISECAYDMAAAMLRARAAIDAARGVE